MRTSEKRAELALVREEGRGSAVSASNCRLVCRVHEGFEEIEHVAQTWDDCVERNGGDIYSTFDWCRTWWEFYGRGRRLLVYLVR